VASRVSPISRDLLHTLAKDVWVGAGAALLLLIALVFAVPLLDDAWMRIFVVYGTTLMWLLLVVAAMCSNLRRIDHPGERRFWIRMATAYGCWAAAEVLYLGGVIDPTEPTGSTIQDSLYFLYYLWWIWALEAMPHRGPDRRSYEVAGMFAWAGRALFATGIFAYFVIIPRAIQPDIYVTWLPSFSFYIALDIYLAGRLVALWTGCRVPRWRFHYGLLGLAMILVAVTDILDVLLVADRIEFISPGILDVRWFAPLCLVLIAVRARNHRFPAPAPQTETPLDVQVKGAPLLAYSFAFPVLHFTHDLIGNPPSELETAREVFVLAWIFLIAGLNLAQHTRLEARNRELQARRREAEERVRLSEQKHRMTLEAAPNSISITRQEDGLFLHVNEYFTKLLGYSREEAVGHTVFDLNLFVDETDRGRFIRILEDEGGVDDFEVQYRRRDGTIVDTLLSARPLEYGGEHCLVAVVTNISARKRAEQDQLELERQLLHSQKLESLGVMAGGIAHDFNNLLVGVLGNADLALLKLPEDSAARSNVEEIGKVAARAAELCSQMLAYSGKGRFVVEPVDLSSAVDEMVHLLTISTSKKASLRLDLASDLPMVEADATQIRQVVMNLITNASEAIGEAAGVISVTTGTAHCDRQDLAEISVVGDLPDGTYVYLEVADSGCGMDPKTMARIFDPFFSTKFSGRGLGLAAVQGIVGGHGGAIRVESEPGRGTTVRVLLPASDRRAAEATSAEPGDQEWRGTGTVLLVDDDDMVRPVAQQMLERLGFSVLTACDGEQAVEILASHQREVVLVLLDMTMPGMDGPETFLEMRRRGLTVPVILSSGHDEQDTTSRFVDRGLAGFIQKPYLTSTLREKMREALEVRVEGRLGADSPDHAEGRI
jgi:PAS domain S-box-containing protein